MELSGYVFETLREDGEFNLYRGRRPGNGEPILMLVPGDSQQTETGSGRLEHEYSLADQLEPMWALRPLAMAQHKGRATLLLSAFDGRPLDALLGLPMELGRFLRIAVALVAALREVHRRCLVHRDLKPSNILVDSVDNIRLTGFGMASRLTREPRPPAAPEIVAGTLAYMSPEQTGRMNRSIDARSDLYSLGIIFYEMLTGELPFRASDPMEWIHCHVARSPTAPGERVRGLPHPIEAIVLTLLAKNAEDRYQTTAGLEVDLRRCLAEWDLIGRVDPFELRARDISDRLLVPERLYGRQAEIDMLTAAFDRVVRMGTAELVLVSGCAGIGKSSVVNELYKLQIPASGFFACGKFGQYPGNVPYATLALALQSLVRQLLRKSDAELSGWREALVKALGSHGQLMVNLIPELPHIVGEQLPVPDLPPREAQNRFYTVLRRFVGAFATADHPLTLFLDDLHRLDGSTLDMLGRLINDPGVQHLLLIGAYRSDETGPEHALTQTLERIRAAGGKVSEISLAPLYLDDISRFIADAVRTEGAHVRLLAELVCERTGGNPFFAIQFVTALADEELLVFDSDTSLWRWDIDKIRAKGITDNIADLMAERLNRLPCATVEALKKFACLGNCAPTHSLCLILGLSREDLRATLWSAESNGLVARQPSAYSFLHDRIQEAAYALIPARETPTAHLRIGRALAAQTPAADFEDRIFEIVNQFNRGVELIESVAERDQVAQLNLIAGMRATNSAAFASALTYFAVGSALLGADGWERRHRLTFDLEWKRAECEFMAGDHASAERRLLALKRRAASPIELAGIVCLAVRLYCITGRSLMAVEIGLEFLQRCGIPWSSHPDDHQVFHEYERMQLQLLGRPIETLIDLPPMTDPICRAITDVLTELRPPAFDVDKNLVDLAVLRLVNLSLQHGNADGSCIAYSALNLILVPRFGDYRTGHRFGELACALVRRGGLDRHAGRVYSAFGSYVMPWAKHLPLCRPVTLLAYNALLANGELVSAGDTYRHRITNLLASGEKLAEVQREAELALEFVKRARPGIAPHHFMGQLALIRSLRDQEPREQRPDGEGEIPQPPLGEPEKRPYLANIEFFNAVFKLQELFFYQNHAAGIAMAAHASRLRWASIGCFEEAEYHFYTALTLAAACDRASAERRAMHMDALAAHYRQIAVWCEHCPENFANRMALIGAEVARLEGRDLDAMRLYEESIRSAREGGFIQNEALGNELAAQFHAARGFETIASTYRRIARSCYVRWGALGKARQLEQRHADLKDEAAHEGSAATFRAPMEQLDVGAMFKASQALSGEIVLGSLIETLMRIAVEHAGAERGALILLRNGEPHIAAEAATAGGKIEVKHTAQGGRALRYSRFCLAPCDAHARKPHTL